MKTIETDYLVIGAGAAGMAYTDALIAACDADVVMLDRRHQAGGHWNDAYPFVKLHQPSAIYGVNSLRLGTDAIDTAGSDAGLYERSGAAEILGYFQRVMETVLLPSGRVRFFGMSDYVGDFDKKHRFVSRLTGAATEVHVRRKVVDTTYLQVSVPATHERPFSVDADTRVIPVGELVNVQEAPSGYTVLGGGKTAMDACYWLLNAGVDADRITWVRPRDAWVLDRRSFQPRELMASSLESFELGINALCEARDMDNLFRLLEDVGQINRFDKEVMPTMYRGAILSEMEFEALKTIRRVVRKGHIKHIGTTRIALEQGDIATDAKQIHVDCSATGIRANPEVPIFGPRRIVLQGLVGGFTTFSAALIAQVEATRETDVEKNKLLAPVSPLKDPFEWVKSYRGFIHVSALQGGAGGADLAAWLEDARLNLTMGLQEAMQRNGVAARLGRIAENVPRALENARRLLGE